MLNWINKVLGGGGAPADVPAEWVKALDAQLSRVDKEKGVRSGLGGELRAYVLHGEPLSVLHEIDGKGKVSDALGLTGYGTFHRLDGRVTSAKLYAAADEVPATILLRWAQVLAAAPGANARWALQFPGDAHWPEALLMHASAQQFDVYGGDPPSAEALSAGTFERMLAEAGMDASAMLTATFATPARNANWLPVEARAHSFATVRGYAAAVERHREALRPLLIAGTAEQRLHMLKMLAPLNADALAHFAPELAELAVCGSKQVRAAAEQALRRCGAAATAPLKRLATEGKPEQRLYALRQLWSLAEQSGDDALRDYARSTARADKAATVQALPDEWESVAHARSADVERYDYALPTIDWSNALTPALRAQLQTFWDEINQSVDKANRQAREHHEKMKAQGHKYPLYLHDGYTDAEFRKLCAYLDSTQSRQERIGKDGRRNHWQHAQPALLRLAAHPEMSAGTLLKLLRFFDLLSDGRSALSAAAYAPINTLFHKRGRPTLLELSLMLDAMALPGRDLIFNSYCWGWGTTLAQDWPDDAVWPFFAHHQQHLIDLLNPVNTREYWFDRKNLYRAIATLPTPPAAVINSLFDLALGTGKSDRAAAQEALANLPGKEARILGALADGKGEVRTVAAQWLARLKHAPAIAALEQAVAKEKHDVPKGAMLDALQALGQPVERYLDRGRLAAEAEKSLAKGLPKELDWFPWASLPTVRWGDNGEAVGADVLRWLLVQAVKQKSPEPNAVLRKYCAMFAARDREAFGQWVLEAWLSEDVRPIEADEAMRRAQAQAQSMHGYMKSYPQYYKDDPHYGKSVEELVAYYLPGFLRQPAGSAVGSKGLLAVAAACAGQRAAAPVARYLKEYYGTRAAQGKALIAMLAWIEHPSATQLMLSVGSRFRTKSFQEEATRQAEALADRKGWTLAELSDRTIPSAGFDETGTLALSYGGREFSAKLLPDFKIEVFNPDGKKIAALPEPRQDDDAALAKDAKKALSNAKKEIKNIVALQTDRLYEALCTERDWSFEDWNLYLNQHPIVRRLVQRLVWSVVEDGRVVATFRPLDDGTLSDNDDHPVTPATDARVRIAHDSNLPAEQVALWQRHLADYEIAPLFQQFGKGTYALPGDKAGQTEIGDFEGHLLEAFALRGRALKLGYTRGPAEDGGWFHIYEKRFPTMGLTAVIEFTGNGLPEQNRTVALLSLSFTSGQGESWNRASMRLSQVPKVLLSECYNDLRLIAAEGSGYDADWRKKSEY